MRKLLLLFVFISFAMGCGDELEIDNQIGEFSSELTKEEISEVVRAVADWQIDNFSSVRHHRLDWTNATLYRGMIEWVKVSSDLKYSDWLYNIGNQYDWQPHSRIYHADDIVVSQTYLEIYTQEQAFQNSNRLLIPTKSRLDFIIENPSNGTLFLNTSEPETLERWSWCDALFMAPPVYTKMYRITNDSKYLDFMDKEFKATYDLLYDQEENLFFRDHTFFPERKLEANGEKIFWGRGNGWVMGGLVLILKDLPLDNPYRPFYEALFKEMAQRIAGLQDEQGFWHASMLDPVSFPNPESSSTAFFCYALAYGINAGLLSREEFQPEVTQSWQALVSAVYTDGKLGWVQPVGGDPQNTTIDMTEVYGVGAFLMAGSEMLTLVE